jgi:hypothetical protein
VRCEHAPPAHRRHGRAARQIREYPEVTVFGVPIADLDLSQLLSIVSAADARSGER